MTVSLGLDIGSNSVGSAWVDTDKREIVLAVSVFPAGVEETEKKRGAPKNQHRRDRRSQRKTLGRRALRKKQLRVLLASIGLLPHDEPGCMKLMAMNPWELRRKALSAPLTPHEFGRILVHLNQRRGAWGVHLDSDEPSESEVGDEETPAKAKRTRKDPGQDKEEAVKKAIGHLAKAMQDAKAETFGQFMADLMDQRRHPIQGKEGKFYHDPIRNRRDAFEFHATRDLIRQEFRKVWEKQRKFGGTLGSLLTDELRVQLDDESTDQTWRHKGIIFGQRGTYWKTKTLRRCDLEPSDRCCPQADMHAQEFRVLETVNNIRITERGSPPRALTPDERAKVKKALQSQKTGSVPTVRKALGIDKAALRRKGLADLYHLNLEADPDHEINTDWFYRQIVHGVFTEGVWVSMPEAQRESVNRALLKFDPDSPADAERLRSGAINWWGLSPEAAEKFIAGWKSRPKLQKRLNLSRRAILNLLPYMRQNGLGVTEARQRFAEDGDNEATPEQRRRYALGGSVMRKADRRFLLKHPDLLPPAPMLTNPVVRKAIHEVRRHIIAYVQRFGRKPDRIVIELARQAKQTEKVRNKILSANRQRENERKAIIRDFALEKLPLNQQDAAVERVRLCREQKEACPYSNLTPGAPAKTITQRGAAKGDDLEVDHIVPYSRSHDNFLSNKVLCYRQANRGKASRTPKEWLTSEQFALLEQRMAHWEKEFPRKWENLHREPEPLEEFLNSQLSDTAYAARQVGGYLRDALYGGERDGKRRVFFTKGAYTAMLRRDWRLFQRLKPAGGDDHDQGGKPWQKSRDDHRRHAVDAAIVALTPDILQDVGRLAAQREEYHERTGYWPRRDPLPPPWGTVVEFRRQVLSQVFDTFDRAGTDGTTAPGTEPGQALVVSHRPVKRKITGFLHKDDLWGPVDEGAGVFRISCPIADLTPKMLRMPVPENDDQVRERLVLELKRTGVSEAQARKVAQARMRQENLARRLVDPALGKGGLVRDWALRKNIRCCLADNRIDPDTFSSKQIQDFAKTGKLRMPGSNVPIKSVITIAPISDPVKIPVKDPRTRQQATNPRTGKPLFRYHISGNNHHIEIREDAKTGRWSGQVVDMFTAARRARIHKQDPVDRSDRDGERFVMSLAEGETVHMRHPDTGQPGYFVVFKLDRPPKIHFIHHWDARPSQAKEDQPPREDIPVVPNRLKGLGVEPGKPPCKVRVSPLGNVVPVNHD